MNIVHDFYRLSEILNDDIYQVANVIRSYSSKELSVKNIVADLEDLQLKDYEKVISCILDLTAETIKNVGKGITFDSELDYISYLQQLMNYSGIEFVPFVRT